MCIYTYMRVYVGVFVYVGVSLYIYYIYIYLKVCLFMSNYCQLIFTFNMSINTMSLTLKYTNCWQLHGFPSPVVRPRHWLHAPRCSSHAAGFGRPAPPAEPDSLNGSAMGCYGNHWKNRGLPCFFNVFFKFWHVFLERLNTRICLNLHKNWD